MVEMVETAAILNQAGPRALVILDEIGRGTATFDGLSIAWACVEHLHEVEPLPRPVRHPLPRAGGAGREACPPVPCHLRVKEWQGDVVFLHEVAAGSADRSYGIHVARLAGLPEAVIARAEQVLEILEKGDQAGSVARLADDLPLFSVALRRKEPAGRQPPRPDPSAVEQALAALNPDDLTRGGTGGIRLRGLLS